MRILECIQNKDFKNTIAVLLEYGNEKIEQQNRADDEVSCTQNIYQYDIKIIHGQDLRHGRVLLKGRIPTKTFYVRYR